uniref:Integrase, catalytic region, zinc finger, CCHC-type, peptidase aspartic, catalytic n=1 Tax=Tanacetum cinerariifolium TaxID=118510 RepID=A0A699GXF8_TANCI|nr:integrase, catalytic region, zinc finger, CCHC-type, peptidase aspartic, catalytic [Tanacetum cinerariifolium]
MTKQECASMLYDEFDKFISEHGESIHSYYLRFSKLINDMNMIPMTMSNMQINTKFANHLQPEWSRFVTAAKQARDLHVVNFDQLYAFLRYNEKDDHVDVYYFDCDDQATANAIFMASLSFAGSLNDDTVTPTYDSNTLFEVPHYDTYHDDMLNFVVQETKHNEHFVSHDDSYAELMSDSNVISYAKYMATI